MIVSYLAGGALVSIEFDATLREEHSGATTITRYNVETGSKPTDHARSENPRVTFDVIVSDTPVKVPKTNRDGVDGGFSNLEINTPERISIPRLLPGVGAIASLIPPHNVTTAVQVLNFDGEMHRTRSVHDELQLLRESATLLNLSSPLKEYTDMLIETVTAPRTAADGSCITFTVVCSKIRFVDSEVVAVKNTRTKGKSQGVKPGSKTPAGPLRSTAKAGAIAAGAASATVRAPAPVPFL